MKDLSYKELQEAPTEIKFLYVASMANQPVGMRMVDDAMSKYPKYFPEEIEYQRKYALIPEHVHEEYYKEKEILHSSIFKDMPESKGISGWANDTNGYLEWSDKYHECRKKELPLSEKLHQKFYKKYGIEWNGW